MSSVDLSGPIVTGAARRHATLMARDITEDLAQETFHEVERILDSSLKNPTGYYESQIRIDMAHTEAAVTDGGVVYGPWLEGVSSRNESSRFKGYASFRRAHQRVEARATQIAQPSVRRHVAAMNGA